MYPFTFANLIRPLTHPKPHYIWVKVLILHETGKAILVSKDPKIWIPKSRIAKIRLKNSVFEVYVEEHIIE